MRVSRIVKAALALDRQDANSSRVANAVFVTTAALENARWHLEMLLCCILSFYSRLLFVAWIISYLNNRK